MKKFSFFLFIYPIIFVSCGQKKDEPQTENIKQPRICNYTRDEKDPLGKRIRVVQDEKFISLNFTDSAAAAHYNSEDFFKGYLSCVRVDTVLGIYFDFKIYTDDAFRYYGLIKKDNKIIFTLKSGKELKLPFGYTFSGNTNLSSELTEYSSFAHLSKNAAHELMSEELQKVRISWSKRDEDYVVVNPKIFINQMHCVK